jgi:hypothetical protein
MIGGKHFSQFEDADLREARGDVPRCLDQWKLVNVPSTPVFPHSAILMWRGFSRSVISSLRGT